ncbi:putative MFS family arabinose efflux permease [Salisediminibacterium halotolerans]|nr:putative MFS family arabinose efflux permease [Actinophytocola xinjiangensis]RPE87821.1 putative MFS family arabinose efflux permease [Salisediminibacterium halotolerans]TWG34923.1 putative MFS family arabinose efflux permease [Salisediminibacterium halotolerans]GEL07890.1 MFS transporter [Salisediminibacterium halotolerans]
MTTILYVLILVAFMDTFIQLPIITPYAQELGASNVLTGSIIAVYSLANMAGNVFGGYWIDRFGRKKMLLTAMTAAAAVLLLYPLAGSGEQLFSIRFLHGLAGGILIPAAFAYVGDKTVPENRGRKMAYTGAAIGIAAIIGPALGGGIAASAETEYVFIFTAVLFAVTVFFASRYLHESFSPPERGKVSLQDFGPVLKEPAIFKAALTAFALMISNGTLAFALPLKIEGAGYSSAFTGALLSVYGVVALIVFLTPLNRVFDRVHPVPLMIAGMIMIGASMIMLSYFQLLIVIILAMVVYGSGFAFVFPSMNRMVADASSAVDRGKAYGIFYSAFSLGVVSGSFLSGAVTEWFGLPFLFASVMILSFAFLLFSLHHRTDGWRRNSIIRS